jgi:hypothetical protein
MFGAKFPANINDPKKKKHGKWVRKTASEISEAQKRIQKSAFSIVMPMGVLLICIVVVWIALEYISEKYLLYCYLFPIVAFIFTYIFQLIKGRALGNSPRIKICSKCLKEDWLGLKRCHCGGTLEPPEFYTFIETSK